MFALQPKPTFKATIAIPVPGDEKAELTIIFKHLGKKGLTSFFDSLTKEGVERSDIDALSELIVGWENVDAKFTKENLESLLDNYPGAALALLMGYRKELMEARVKN